MSSGHETSRADNADLSHRRAVVTGASSGLGRAIAIELARGGAELVIHGNANERGLAETADEIAGLGRPCETILADIRDDGDRGRLIAGAQQNGEIDIWVNNAGADVLTGDAAGWSFEEKLARLWQVDVRGTIGLSRDVGQLMVKRDCPAGRCCILNVGWDRADHGMAGDSGEMFAAVKGAIMSFTKSLAQSLAPQVRVNCLAPGWIRTKWGERASDYWDGRAKGDALLGRWGEPRDVAGVARFLATDSAAFITGQIINVNGGSRH
ncbi:MAG: SDR family oxidoreductase [Pirellulaceae bacterium]|jgi:3-oxoacyl-[acyl-carrier protein] reductase|nr:SDR family oxidoreductase [Pirellulaceae bacterium]MDP7019968.1 SDR family oxidoreductase [Pirellulaceae bacterium]